MSGLLDAWDRMNSAVNQMLTAQPHRVTECAERLDSARQAMGDAIRASIRTPPPLPTREDVADLLRKCRENEVFADQAADAVLRLLGGEG